MPGDTRAAGGRRADERSRCKGRDLGTLQGKLEEWSLCGDGEENAGVESAFESGVSPQWECVGERAASRGAGPAHQGRQQLVDGREATMKFCLFLFLESLSLSS